MTMFEDESIGRQRRTTWHWERMALLTIPVVAIIVVIMVLQPWSIANKFHNDMTKANAVMSDVESYRATGSTTYDDPEGYFSQLSMEGGFISPNRYYMAIVDNNQVSEFIIIGDILFITNEQLFNPSSFAFMQYYRNFFDEEMLSNYLDILIDIKKLPNEEIEGISCIHYTGQWDIEKYISVMREGLIETQTSMGIEVNEEEIDSQLELMSSMKMSVEFWIGSNDYLVRQTKTNIQYPDYLVGFNISTSSMTVTYSDFYEPIIIEAPIDDEGQLLSGWHMIDIEASYPR